MGNESDGEVSKVSKFQVSKFHSFKVSKSSEESEVNIDLSNHNRSASKDFLLWLFGEAIIWGSLL